MTPKEPKISVGSPQQMCPEEESVEERLPVRFYGCPNKKSHSMMNLMNWECTTTERKEPLGRRLV